MANVATTRIYDVLHPSESWPLGTNPSGGVLTALFNSTSADVVVDAAFSSDDQRVAVLQSRRNGIRDTGTSSLTLYDRKGQSQMVADIPASGRAVAFDPTENRVAVLGGDGSLHFYLVKENELSLSRTVRLHSERDVRAMPAPNHYVHNGRVEFTADGRRVYVWGLILRDVSTSDTWEDNELHLFNVNDGQRALRQRILGTSYVSDAIVSSDDGLIVIGDSSGHTLVFDYDSGQLRAGLETQSDRIFSVSLMRASGRQKSGLLMTSCRDGAARVWDWRKDTRRPIAELQHGDEVFCARFIPDSPYVVTSGADGYVKVWNRIDGRLVSPPLAMSGHEILSVEIASLQDPNRLFAIASGLTDHVHRWDLSYLKCAPMTAVSDLRELATVVSGIVVDDNGNVRRLSASEWMATWKRVKAGPLASQLEFPSDASRTNAESVK